MSDDSERLDDLAAELVEQTEAKYQATRDAQDEFLDTVAEQQGAETLETTCNLIGDYTVTVKAKLSGDVLDRMGALEDKLERLETGDGRAYEVSETADELSQILADMIMETEWHKDKFYAAYKSEGLAPLGVMIKRVFDALKDERKRRQGAADGFRQQ